MRLWRVQTQLFVQIQEFIGFLDYWALKTLVYRSYQLFAFIFLTVH